MIEILSAPDQRIAGHHRLSFREPRGADLRLVAPEGNIGHTRRFLPEGDYANLNPAVLRKADGTGFFLPVPAVPVGKGEKAYQYRLQMTYRRDNRVVQPASPVLSQAGHEEPEPRGKSPPSGWPCGIKAIWPYWAASRS